MRLHLHHTREAGLHFQKIANRDPQIGKIGFRKDVDEIDRILRALVDFDWKWNLLSGEADVWLGLQETVDVAKWMEKGWPRTQSKIVTIEEID